MRDIQSKETSHYRGVSFFQLPHNHARPLRHRRRHQERMFQARTTSSILNSQLSRSLFLPSTQKSTFHTMIYTNHAFILTNHSFIYTNKTFIYSFWCLEVKSPAYIYQFPSPAISAFIGKLTVFSG